MYKKLIVAAALCCSLTISAAASVAPDGGADARYYGSGTTIHVTWDDDLDAEVVNVELWNADLRQFTVLAVGIPAAVGDHQWTVPAGFPAGERFRFVVRDALNPRRYDMSSGWVSINMPQAIVNSVTMIDDGSDIQVRPMPASDRLTVSWGDRSVTEIELVDIHHRQILKRTAGGSANHLSMDLGAVSSGMIFVRVHDARGSVIAKPVVIRR